MGLTNHKNFAITYVAVAPVPPDSGTTLEVVDGTVLPAVPFKATVCPILEQPINDNAEIVLVTNVTGNVVTMDRGAEGTTPRAIQVMDQFFASWTSDMLGEVENSLSIVKLRVEVIGTNDSPETFTSNVGKLQYNFGTTPFRAIDLSTYNVSVIPVSLQEATIFRISDIAQIGTDITFDLAISASGNPSPDGKFYCDIIINLQKL